MGSGAVWSRNPADWCVLDDMSNTDRRVAENNLMTKSECSEQSPLLSSLEYPDSQLTRSRQVSNRPALVSVYHLCILYRKLQSDYPARKFDNHMLGPLITLMIRMCIHYNNFTVSIRSTDRDPATHRA